MAKKRKKMKKKVKHQKEIKGKKTATKQKRDGFIKYN
jgi:hypothetical protein